MKFETFTECEETEMRPDEHFKHQTPLDIVVLYDTRKGRYYADCDEYSDCEWYGPCYGSTRSEAVTALFAELEKRGI